MPDFNLLVTLDVLLKEGSVAGAARRLNLSPSAMSRALARLREVTGDPLLVRAGRNLVPTPRAVELRDQVGSLVDGANAILRPAKKLDPSKLVRRFVLRTSEGFVETFGSVLLDRFSQQAPGITLQFLTKTDKESAPLRDGDVDLETGVIDAQTASELRALPLFEDRWVGVVNSAHPFVGTSVSASQFIAGNHVLVVRRGLHSNDVDDAFRSVGMERRVATIVNGFSSAIALARQSDLIATVPERHTEGIWKGMHVFPLPIDIAPFTISMLWHPRMDGDLAHRWFRTSVREVCIAHIRHQI